MMTAFAILKRFKGLRGTWADPFGYTEERQKERALRDAYLDGLNKLAADLTADNHRLAIAIAHVPDSIRGFGHVKDAAMEKAAIEEADLWTNWPVGKLPAQKTTLIGTAN